MALTPNMRVDDSTQQFSAIQRSTAVQRLFNGCSTRAPQAQDGAE